MSFSDITGAIGTGSGVLALAVAIWAAHSAKDSAGEARRLRQQDSERLQLERDARHDALAPTMPGVITGYLKTSHLGGDSLYGTLVFPRDYRVRGVANVGNGYTPLGGLPLLVRAHQPYEIHIEHWPPGRVQPQTISVDLQVWPPNPDLDPVDPWICPCGRQALERGDRPGHWKVSARIDFDNPPIEDTFG